MTYTALVDYVQSRPAGGVRVRFDGRTGWLTTGPHYDSDLRAAGVRVLRMRIGGRKSSGRQYRTLFARDVTDGRLEVKVGPRFMPARRWDPCD